MAKDRLDKFLLNQISTRAKAQDMIKEGKVKVNDKTIKKCSFLVDENDVIEVLHTEDEFVSRGAFKLKGCLDQYHVSIKDQVVLDIGASTGGFTDVCLRYGAKKVYALDVGHYSLPRNLKKIVVLLKWKDITQEKSYRNGLMNQLNLCVWMLVLFRAKQSLNMF